MDKIEKIDFLQQPENNKGDYTKERRVILDQVTREEFFKDLQKIRNKANNSAS